MKIQGRLPGHFSVGLKVNNRFWVWLLAGLGSAVVLALVLVFSVLFFALLTVIVMVALVRTWWVQRRVRREASGKIIEAEYEVIEREERSGNHANRAR